MKYSTHPKDPYARLWCVLNLFLVAFMRQLFSCRKCAAQYSDHSTGGDPCGTTGIFVRDSQKNRKKDCKIVN